MVVPLHAFLWRDSIYSSCSCPKKQSFSQLSVWWTLLDPSLILDNRISKTRPNLSLCIISHKPTAVPVLALWLSRWNSGDLI